jgi:hypothetical protein
MGIHETWSAERRSRERCEIGSIVVRMCEMNGGMQLSKA